MDTPAKVSISSPLHFYLGVKIKILQKPLLCVCEKESERESHFFYSMLERSVSIADKLMGDIRSI